MQAVISSFIFAMLGFYGKYHIEHFATHLKRNIFEDFNAICPNQINFKKLQNNTTFVNKRMKFFVFFEIIITAIPFIFYHQNQEVWFILALLVYLSFLDIHYLLTDIRAIIIILTCSLFHLINNSVLEIDLYLMSTFISIIFIIINSFYEQIFRKTLIGQGDLLLLTALSPLLSFDNFILLILISCIIGIAIYIILRVKLGNNITKIAFIPSISLALAILFITIL